MDNAQETLEQFEKHVEGGFAGLIKRAYYEGFNDRHYLTSAIKVRNNLWQHSDVKGDLDNLLTKLNGSK